MTGKYLKDALPNEGRIVENKMYNTRYSDPVYYEVSERFVEYANKQGMHPVTLAVSWVKSHPAVTAPIIGARNLAQLEDSLAAAEFEMSPEMYDEITRLSIAPPTATDRLEEVIDPKYKTRNRQAAR